MMKSITGYILTCAGFIGFVYFRYYKGSMIPYPFAWQGLCFITGLAGLWLTVQGKKGSDTNNVSRPGLNWKKIVMTPVNCEVRENNYYESSVHNTLTTSTVFDALYDPERNVSQELVEQSALIYYYENRGARIKMTSQTFPFNAEKLSSYIKAGKIILFINPSDHNDYSFEILS